MIDAPVIEKGPPINMLPPDERPEPSTQFMEKISHDFGRGGEIPTYTEERQQRIRERLLDCENRLNALFDSAINPNRRAIAPDVEFLTTPEFFEEMLGEEKLPKETNPLVDLILATLQTRGLRSTDGKRVMIHTTIYDPQREPEQMSDDEAFVIGRHELTHGKVEPKILQISPTRQERRTGCKVITLENDKPISVHHASLYEAQTDALAVISSHPEIQTWEDVFTTYLHEHPDHGTEYGFQLSALTRLMQFAFPDFKAGVSLLGESYFRSDSEGFIHSLTDAIQKKNIPQLDMQFRLFLTYSEHNAARIMAETVRDMLQTAIPKET